MSEPEQQAREAFGRLHTAASTTRPDEQCSVAACDLQALLNAIGPPPKLKAAEVPAEVPAKVPPAAPPAGPPAGEQPQK